MNTKNGIIGNTKCNGITLRRRLSKKYQEYNCTNSRSSKSGFTIIEVMIVLAIAGMILLLVLMMVPGLQRSQRNTARRSDVGRVSAAIVDFVSNSVNAKALQTDDETLYIPACTKLVRTFGTLSYYNFENANACTMLHVGNSVLAGPRANAFSIQIGTQITTAPQPDFYTSNVMVLVEQAQCTPGSNNSITPSSPQQLALLYNVESGNGWLWVCVNL